jgi:hypothetical protein
MSIRLRLGRRRGHFRDFAFESDAQNDLNLGANIVAPPQNLAEKRIDEANRRLVS